MATPSILAQLPKYTRDAVQFYWETRSKQLQKQRDAGGIDQRLRSAATGGAQMNGFTEVFTQLVIQAGIDRAHIYYNQSLELPGYFRPNKKWDFIVVVNCQLVAALKINVHCGSFTEDNSDGQETMCDALDLWAAYRTAPGTCVRPWVGFLMFVEAPAAMDEMRAGESATVQAGNVFCRRLFLERIYDNTALIVSNLETTTDSEPIVEFPFEKLALSIFGRVEAFSRRIQNL